MTQRRQIDFLTHLEMSSTADDDHRADQVNLLQGMHANWKLAGSGVSNPTIERIDIAAPDGSNSGLQIFYPAVSETSQFSLLYQHPTQALNTRHRFKVYLRGEAGGETVWLSHSPAPVAFSREKCKLSSEWQEFVLDYRTSRSGEQ